MSLWKLLKQKLLVMTRATNTRCSDPEILKYMWYYQYSSIMVVSLRIQMERNNNGGLLGDCATLLQPWTLSSDTAVTSGRYNRKQS